ncbi:hypothetical protein Lepto7375DRAFT_8159 [Leptolyngbya sp. PCC 7375]|nr:hypothetical protein Lepto7375DRAFT_8159 [Leptolyngbya sp. PCC 7375]
MDKQSDDVMTAILDGKYSWACVLWLRGKGYNPKEYIPCRTYNRLLKQQQIDCKQNNNSAGSQHQNSTHGTGSQITDLSYLKDSHKNDRSVRGGFRNVCSRFKLNSSKPLSLH